MKDIKLWQGDYLELMNNIHDKSIDAIITYLEMSLKILMEIIMMRTFMSL